MKEYLKNIAPNAEVSGLLWKVRNHYGCPGTSSAQQRPDRGVGRRPVRILRRRIRCPVPHPTVAGKSRFKARRNVHTPGHDLRAHPAGPGLCGVYGPPPRVVWRPTEPAKAHDFLHFEHSTKSRLKCGVAKGISGGRQQRGRPHGVLDHHLSDNPT